MNELMKRREFITLLGGRRRRGRWRRGRSSRSCRPSVSWAGPRLRARASGPPLLCSACANSAGSRDAPSRSNIAGRRAAAERYTEIATEFVRLKVDVIVTYATAPVIATKQATSEIPIVFALMGDPVGTGLVVSLARPGGNVTGLSTQQTDLACKRLEFLREVPGLRRLAILANIDSPPAVLVMREVQAAASALGIEVATVEVRRAQDIAPAFEALKGRVDALYVAIDPLVNTNRIRINTLALGARLPTMHGIREVVEAGGLMSYGANQPDLFRRAADFVDKILRGAKPSDLPVEQPTKFDLVINLTTAKALGIEISSTLLARADEVIE